MWGVLASSQPHWVCLRSRHVCFPCLHCLGSRLLCWELTETGLGLYALPRSKVLRFRYTGSPQRRRISSACILCPSQFRAAQVTRCLVSVLSRWAMHLNHLLPQPLGFQVHCESTISGVLRRVIQKRSHNPDNHDGVTTHLEPDILECEVKWVLGSIATNKASGGDGNSS